MRGRTAIAAVGLLATVAVLVAGIAAPGVGDRWGLLDWGEAMAEAAGAAACLLAARAVRGPARAGWSLFAAGLLIWSVTDALYAAAAMRGVDVPEVSVFDVGWLAFYVPMLGGASLIYLRLRPERGWQGLLDGLLLSTAAAAIGWNFVLAPAADQASGGATGTLVAVLYPVLDLAILTALGWILLRHRTRTPVWLRWIAAAFAAQAAAGLAYVAGTVNGVGPAIDAVSAAGFVLAGVAWTVAGLTRVEAASWRQWTAKRDVPPPWSESVPFMVGAAVVALGAVVPTPQLRAAAVVAAVVMASRAIDALSVRRRLLAERDRLLVTDPLTGTYNRRFLAMEADRAFARARRGQEPVSAIAIDLDGFKAVNDRFGHGAGDELLRAVASGIAGELRLGDLLCRLGGDEFVVLCPSTGEVGAMELAERIRRTVRRASEGVVPEQPVTVSIGVATFPGDAADPSDLMRRADVALYAGKHGGRDRVVPYRAVAEEGPLARVPVRQSAPTRA